MEARFEANTQTFPEIEWVLEKSYCLEETKSKHFN